MGRDLKHTYVCNLEQLLRLQVIFRLDLVQIEKVSFSAFVPIEVENRAYLECSLPPCRGCRGPSPGEAAPAGSMSVLGRQCRTWAYCDH